MVKIVVVDGYAMNPGDLSWEPLESLGDCEIYDQTTADKVIERCQNAAIVITNKVKFDRPTIEALPQLQYIGVTATGVDNIDLEAAKANNVTVTNVPGYSTDSVAQHTFALLLELTNRTGYHNDLVHQGKWQQAGIFSFYKTQIQELRDLTLGIAGYGDIGRRIAEIGRALGMFIYVYTRSPRESTDYVRFVDWDSFLRESDVITLHCPLTQQTRRMLDAQAFNQMKNTAMVINTARGGLIDEAALAAALKEGRLAGAAVDVLADEPPKADCPLLNLANCVVTSHIAWASFQARSRLFNEVVDNVQSFINQTPRNVVV